MLFSPKGFENVILSAGMLLCLSAYGKPLQRPQKGQHCLCSMQWAATIGCHTWSACLSPIKKTVSWNRFPIWGSLLVLAYLHLKMYCHPSCWYMWHLFIIEIVGNVFSERCKAYLKNILTLKSKRMEMQAWLCFGWQHGSYRELCALDFMGGFGKLGAIVLYSSLQP